MPLRTAKPKGAGGRAFIIYINPVGKRYGGTVETGPGLSRGAAPSAPAVGQTGTGGTLGAATYSYRITQIINGLETLASTAGTVVVAGGTTNVANVTWTNNPAASGYRIYGRTGGSEALMATLPAGSTAFNDTGAITPSGAVPSALAGDECQLRIAGYPGVAGLSPSGGRTGAIPKATALRQLNRYYEQF